MEVKAENIYLLRQTRDFQQLQDANALSAMIGANPAGLAGEINLFKPFMPERTDHATECRLFS
jgi:hypothetical protein